MRFNTIEFKRIDYSLLIRSTNSSGVSISILEKPNHFLPKSLMDAHHCLYKGSGHVINGMFQHQSVHIEHYDGLCRVGTDALFTTLSTLLTAS